MTAGDVRHDESFSSPVLYLPAGFIWLQNQAINTMTNFYNLGVSFVSKTNLICSLESPCLDRSRNRFNGR